MSEETCFLNVDLDVESSEDLTALIREFERHAYSLERPPGRASFEIEMPSQPVNPDALISKFVGVIDSLPNEARDVWDRCASRVFDIGIQSGRHPRMVSCRLAPATLSAAARVGAEIAVTAYSLEQEAG